MRALQAFRVFGMCLCLLVCHYASAQSRYSCPTSNGSYVISSTPCTSQSSIVYYGPSAGQAPQPTYIPKVPDAPEHLKHLGPRCSSMSDAIRTGPARGLKSETITALHKEYRRECAEEESEAFRKLARERTDARSAKQAEKTAMAQEQQRSQLAQQQCDESKRILFTKKRRTDLTDGEKADLQRFEDNFKSRCS